MEGDGATTMRKNIAAVYHDASNAGRQRTWWLGLVGQHVEQGQKNVITNGKRALILTE